VLSVSRVGGESTKWMKEPESALGQPNGLVSASCWHVLEILILRQKFRVNAGGKQLL
jgi:hypothetical protein